MPSKPSSLKVDRIYYYIYGAVILWLLPGLARVGDKTAINAFVLYVSAFCLTAFFVIRRNLDLRIQCFTYVPWHRLFHYTVVTASICFPLFHWQQLGEIPLLQAFKTPDYFEVVLIRQQIFENAGSFWRYGSSIDILSVLPFVLFLFFLKRSRWFWPFAVFSLFYAASLLQKSYVIVVFLPTVIIAVARGRFRVVAILCMLSAFSIFLLTLATHPHLRPELLKPPKTIITPKLSYSQSDPKSAGTKHYGKLAPLSSEMGRSDTHYFNGNRSIVKRRTDTDWGIGLSDFSLSFWFFPIKRLQVGVHSILYWNGPGKPEYRGASYIAYGVNENQIPYIAFKAIDRSGNHSIEIVSENKLNLNKWNHIHVSRNGINFYLSVNGNIVKEQSRFIDLSIDREDSAIVQFGSQFEDEVPEIEKHFFKGYIRQIDFTRKYVKYSDNVLAPNLLSPPTLARASEQLGTWTSSRKLQSPPLWLSDLMPPWLVGLFYRVVFVPGEVVGNWFAVIPVDLPFAYGCGYRPVAAMLGCAHQNFPQLVYSIYNRSLVKQGVSGTMNAAGFMDEYANFGLPGLIVSGVIMAVLLYLLGILFAGRRAIGIALNAVPLLFLSSGALLTLLVSGGWLTTLLLYVVFYSELDNGLEGEVCAV